MVVIDLYSLEEIEIPNTHIQCSICGEWNDPSQYCRDGESTMSRTNCARCFESDRCDWDGIKAKVSEIRRSVEYRRAVSRLGDKQEKFGHSITVEELIAELQKLNPSDRLLITDADGYIEPCAPEFHSEANGTKFFRIG